MIIKIDASTEAKVRQLQKSVQQKTGMSPQNISLVVQVLVNVALDSMKDSMLHELAPKMLTLAQQRKAVVSELNSLKQQLSLEQIKNVMKALEKSKQNALKNESTISDKTI